MDYTINSLEHKERFMILFLKFKKNLNASRPSEHPTQGGKMSKRLVRWDHWLQRQNIFMALKQVVYDNVFKGKYERA